MKIELRDYQIKSITDIRNAYIKGFRAPLLVSPCGSGKTVIFAYIAENASRKQKRILILVHRRELLLQSSEMLDELGVEHGIIAPKSKQTDALVQIGSVQTVVNRLDKLEYPDLIIIDEAHHTRAKSFSDIINYFSRSLLLGVTATPIRLDSKGLGKKSGGFFDILIQGPTPKELISQGYLAEPIVYAPPSKVDFSQVRTKFGDFDKKETADLVDKPKITGDCIEHYQRICPSAPAIAFTISIEHAEHVAKAFNDAGIPAMSIDGKKSNDERKFILDSLEDGTIQVVTSCDLISEGLDIPKVTCAIGLRPTASLCVWTQQSGRPLRPYPGKTYCYILDHVGNIHRHGSPIADRDWTLDAEEIGPSKGLAPERKDFWICDKCYASNNMSDDICEQCGEGRKVNSREIKEIEGQLQKIKEEEIERDMKWNKKKERKQATTLEDLQALEKARGYKRGWAEFVYNGRRGR